MKKVKIFYGTGGGNTELVCEKVSSVLEAAGFSVEMVQAKLASAKDVGGAGLMIFASPTYGHGQLENYFAKFLAACRDVNLKGRRCAVIGLGDDKYDSDYFIESARIIGKFLEEKEADVVCEPLMIAKNPIPHLEGVVKDWAKRLAKK